MSACWIALGGNLGSVAETFQRALTQLDQTPGLSLVQRSHEYTTAPVGTNSGEQFLNAAAEFETSRSPMELLGILQSVETQLGRQRTLRWGPRTLDLDLLLYEQQVLNSATLTIPHPHLWYRRFVLNPLHEIAPDLVHPQHQLTISTLRQRLLVRPLPCLLCGGDATERQSLQAEMATAFPQTIWLEDQPESAWLIFSMDPQGSVATTAPPLTKGGQGGLESLSATESSSEIRTPQPGSISTHSTRIIHLHTFPTPPRESLRDILTAALDAARIASPQ